MHTFETPNGKKLELYNEGFSVKARWVGGGELPVELSGKWSDIRFATNDITIYLDKMKTKKDKRYKPELNKEDYKRD